MPDRRFQISCRRQSSASASPNMQIAGAQSSSSYSVKPRGGLRSMKCHDAFRTSVISMVPSSAWIGRPYCELNIVAEIAAPAAIVKGRLLVSTDGSLPLSSRVDGHRGRYLHPDFRVRSNRQPLMNQMGWRWIRAYHKSGKTLVNRLLVAVLVAASLGACSYQDRRNIVKAINMTSPAVTGVAGGVTHTYPSASSGYSGGGGGNWHYQLPDYAHSGGASSGGDGEVKRGVPCYSCTAPVSSGQ
jgi:hypothetical protein